MTKNPMTDDRKMIIILKKEIEDYRSNVKKIQYNSKKDMMIKLLIDELDKQHKRINFFESKIKDYKSQMLRMEDALQVRSHRLLLRSAFKPGKQQNSLGVDNITNSKRSSRAQSADVSRRQQQQEGIAEESNEEASITNQQIILGSIQESPIYLDENNNSPRSLLQYDMMDRLELDYRNQQELQSQYLNGMIDNKQFSPRSQGIKVDLTPEMKDQEIQENGDQFDETIIKRESFILSSDNQKYVKAVINREDLLQDICGKDQSKRQIEQNVTTLIHDLERSVSLLKQFNKVAEYVHQPKVMNDKSLDFFAILEEFHNKSSTILNCEQIRFFMIDQPSNEIIAFTKDSLLKFNFNNIFPKLKLSKIPGDRLIINDLETLKNYVNVDQLKLALGYTNSHPIESILLSKFQIQGKQGLTIAINSSNFDINLKSSKQAQHQVLNGQFTDTDNEILSQMSTSCLRKLNRERDFDLKFKLIKAYKSLFKIGINLQSRSNYASLLYESEKQLKSMLSLKQNVSVLIVDHERQMFVKLNIFGLNVDGEGEQKDKNNNNKSDFPNLPDGLLIEGNLMYVPFKGLAQHCVSQKKTLVITDPLSQPEYDDFVDLRFQDINNAVPIICVPIFNKESQDNRVEGCIETEFKVKHYLSSNPFLNINNSNQNRKFNLDAVAKEVLEIFSNQLRIAIERLNIIKWYQSKLSKFRHLQQNQNDQGKQQHQDQMLAISDTISPIKANEKSPNYYDYYQSERKIMSPVQFSQLSPDQINKQSLRSNNYNNQNPFYIDQQNNDQYYDNIEPLMSMKNVGMFEQQNEEYDEDEALYGQEEADDDQQQEDREYIQYEMRQQLKNQQVDSNSFLNDRQQTSYQQH
eukprot:403337202